MSEQAPGDARHPVSRATTTGGVPVDASIAPALDVVAAPSEPALVDGRTAAVCDLTILTAISAGFIAKGLTALIAITRAGIRAFWASPDRTVPRVRLIEMAPVEPAGDQ